MSSFSSLQKALRMILQLGVKRSWFDATTNVDQKNYKLTRNTSSADDLRSYMIDLPPVGDSVVPELLLKVLEPYRREGWSILIYWLTNFAGKMHFLSVYVVCPCVFLFSF